MASNTFISLSDILMHRIFKTRPFTRWMRKNRMTDMQLREAVREMQDGLIDARLGGHLLKKRIALPGKGKRGSARTIVATRLAGTWIFLVGFNKNERASISPDELQALQQIATVYLSLDSEQLQTLIDTDELSEVLHAAN
jgi:hypothetical protein